MRTIELTKRHHAALQNANVGDTLQITATVIITAIKADIIDVSELGKEREYLPSEATVTLLLNGITVEPKP